MNSEDHDLLIKIHEIVRDLPSRLEAHEKWDNQRFLYVGIAIIIVASATGILPQLLNHIKLGGA